MKWLIGACVACMLCIILTLSAYIAVDSIRDAVNEVKDGRARDGLVVTIIRWFGNRALDREEQPPQLDDMDDFEPMNYQSFAAIGPPPEVKLSKEGEPTDFHEGW